tara:strand:- start:880 stop:1296 length:417 start_codon:yes stop_codon:yes gene_type:complete
MELDLFEQWFEGEFDNWGQASSNPTKWAHIFVKHEKVDDHKFLTTSTYNYSPGKPYREQVVEIIQPSHDQVIVLNPACDMIFDFNKDKFYFDGQSSNGCTWKGKPLESKAKLFMDAYHTWDKGYWHGSEGFFIFKKKL